MKYSSKNNSWKKSNQFKKDYKPKFHSKNANSSTKNNRLLTNSTKNNFDGNSNERDKNKINDFVKKVSIAYLNIL